MLYAHSYECGAVVCAQRGKEREVAFGYLKFSVLYLGGGPTSNHEAIVEDRYLSPIME